MDDIFCDDVIIKEIVFQQGKKMVVAKCKMINETEGIQKNKKDANDPHKPSRRLYLLWR
jgi:hypothetical protein